jgi:hypothetical protein
MICDRGEKICLQILTDLHVLRYPECGIIVFGMSFLFFCLSVRLYMDVRLSSALMILRILFKFGT